MIHHIAIGTPHPSHLAKFYLKIPGSKKIQEFYYESGEIRSLWIGFGPIILMLEEGEKQSPALLFFFFGKRSIRMDPVFKPSKNPKPNRIHCILFG